jgi:CPA2 family monovalent cation:H+ antiporter-2
VARARYVEQLDSLYAAGASQVVAEEFESTIDLVSKVLRGFDISQPAIAQFAEQLREEGYQLLRGPLMLPIDPWLADVLEEVGAEWLDVPESLTGSPSIAELDVRAQTGANILAIRRADMVHPNPPPDFRIRPDDSLLILGSGRQIPALRALLMGSRRSGG